MKKYLIALLFVPAMAHAEFMSGNKLLNDLQSANVIDRMVGMGYVQGVMDAHTRALYCPPNGITAGQVTDMAKKYLEENPSIRHTAADGILAQLFKPIWPCPKRGTAI